MMISVGAVGDVNVASKQVAKQRTPINNCITDLAAIAPDVDAFAVSRAAHSVSVIRPTQVPHHHLLSFILWQYRLFIVRSTDVRACRLLQKKKKNSARWKRKE
jgi:hypothetical protein